MTHLYSVTIPTTIRTLVRIKKVFNILVGVSEITSAYADEDGETGSVTRIRRGIRFNFTGARGFAFYWDSSK